MKSIVTFTFAIALALGCAADTARADDEPKADENFDESAVLYTLGHVLARNVEGQLKPLKLDDGEMKRVVKGLRDGLDGRKPEVDLAEHEPKIQDLARVRMAATAAAERAAGEQLLAQAAAEKGAVKSDTGLVFRSLEEGSGKTPEATDTVRVHYHGTLRNGAVFDSSKQRGEPAVFPLNRVIPCWTEALQKMKVGGKAKITCPPQIAYGDRGAPPTIQPGATLVFDVELLGIEVQ